MTLEQIVCLVIIIAIVATIFIFRAKTTPTAEQKEEAKEFLNKISDKILEIISNTLKEKDPTIFLDFDSFRADLVYGIYDATWEYVENELAEEFKDKPQYSMIVKLITKETVGELVDKLLSDNSIYDKISTVFETAVAAKNKEMEEEDKAAAIEAEKYENEDVEEDYNGEHDVSEFEAGRASFEEVEIPDEVEHDTENDETVEVVDIVEEEVETANMMETINIEE